LIERLESLANEGKRLPLSRRALIDPGQILELVDQIRVSIPTTVTESEEILQQRERIVGKAHQEAQLVRSAAKSESKTRLKEHELVKQARDKADEITQDAEQRAQRLLDKVNAATGARQAAADKYAQEVLRKLEQDVATIHTTICHGIEALNSGNLGSL
jgi:cell division septum initiation protein DivIVA